MKKGIITIAIILTTLLTGCNSISYNEIAWENKKKDIEIEILKKQITIDSLKRHSVFKIDTVHTGKYKPVK